MTESILRSIIREEARNLQESIHREAHLSIIRNLLPNSTIKRDEQGRVPGGSGEVVTLRNGSTFLVRDDLEVFDESGRKSEAAELLEIVIQSQT